MAGKKKKAISKASNNKYINNNDINRKSDARKNLSYKKPFTPSISPSRIQKSSPGRGNE